MNIRDMTVKDVFVRSFKKVIIEAVSVKFWAAVFLGYLIAHVVRADHKADLFLLIAFLVLLGIREAADLLQQKQGGEKK